MDSKGVAVEAGELNKVIVCLIDEVGITEPYENATGVIYNETESCRDCGVNGCLQLNVLVSSTKQSPPFFGFSLFF